MKRKTTTIFFVCYFAYMSIYIARLNLSMAAPGLKEMQILSIEQIGILGSVFSIVYACGRLASGIVGDRVTPWKMIALGLTLCGVSNICFGLFPPFPAIVMLWSVNALAQSMLWGCVLRIVSAVYPENAAKKMGSYLATTVPCGNLVAILMGSALINRFGLSWAFLVPGSITLTAAVLIVCNTRHIHPEEQQKASQSFGNLMKNPSVQHMLAPVLIHGVLKDNISLWMTVYVMDTFGVNLEQSSYYILLIPALGFVSRFLAPEIYRWTREQERPVLAGGFAACVCCCLLLIFRADSAGVAIVYLSLLYMSLSIVNACFLTFFPLRFAREGAVSSVSGIMDFASYLGTGISSVVFGVMIEGYGYNAMFITWAVICGIALLLQLSGRKLRKQDAVTG